MEYLPVTLKGLVVSESLATLLLNVKVIEVPLVGSQTEPGKTATPPAKLKVESDETHIEGSDASVYTSCAIQQNKTINTNRKFGSKYQESYAKNFQKLIQNQTETFVFDVQSHKEYYKQIDD